MKKHLIALASLFALAGGSALAGVYNLKVVTDQSPDYSDLDTMAHSITSNWKSDKDKMWALFYWNHIARRQTNPISIHGKPETDPIRQFNDHGFTMCSTISGINCAIWSHMGYKVKYYDIAVHTVSEVFYDDAWHLYDSSLSSYYTLCDGKTVAGVQDIGKTLGCEASGGKEEAGHIALYHCVNATSPHGFLEGADTMRDLAHLGEDTFNPKYLKYRYYFNDAERGHRYILNLRDNESYARHYLHLDQLKKEKDNNGDPDYFINSGKMKDGTPRDPEAKNARYKIRGTGVRTFTPALGGEKFESTIHSYKGIKSVNSTLQPEKAGEAGEAIFKVEGGNVIASMKINAELAKASADDVASIAISLTNGLTWKDVYASASPGDDKPEVKLRDDVNGHYEVLVKVTLKGDAKLNAIKFDTITQVNGKTQPQLKLGANTVYVGAGEQTESIVFWPELQSDRYKPYTAEAVNIKTKKDHEGWNGVLGIEEKGKEGYMVYKIDAPNDITQITQGARMYVRAKNAEVRFEHSFDNGQTWIKSYTFNDTEQPWDDIHHQVIKDVPAGTKSVLIKYNLKECSIYSIRMEVNHKVVEKAISPVEVTFTWDERQEDYKTIERSHTQVVEKMPFTYKINVGGADHPIVKSMTVNTKGDRKDAKYGYSDGKDVGGEKWVGQWVTYGKNLAVNKPYKSNTESDTQWGAGDPDGKILTDGVVGSGYNGGTAFTKGALYAKGTSPEIVVDLGAPTKFKAVRAHIHGYPGADAIKGNVKDRIEVLTSNDGNDFKSQGEFDFKLRWKDIPVNFMYTDEETFAAHNHLLQMKEPVEARYVKFKVTVGRQKLGITEFQVLDSVKFEPFDLKIALPTTVAKTALAK